MSHGEWTEAISAEDIGKSQPAPGSQKQSSLWRAIAASRLFMLVTLLSALAYLSFFKYLEVVTGTPPMAAPSYFVLYYTLIAVSSVLIGLNIFSAKTRIGSNVASSSSSAATSVSGGIVSCFCHTSLILPLLSLFSSGGWILVTLVEYQFWILATFIALNLYMSYTVLKRIHRYLGDPFW